MKAYLILADGTVFAGESIGKSGEVIGEAVFTTAMTGYMETLTDPSFYGQLIVHTFPLIGNCGAIEADGESERPGLAGYIVRELCSEGSNFRKESELDEYLKKYGVVGISGIDTRELTRKIRDSGAMNAMISDSKNDLLEKLKRIKTYKIKNAVANASTKEVVKINEGGKYRIVLWDFGAKRNIERELVKRDCEVIRVPYNIRAKDIAEMNPDGIMLSNGGGDPAENTEVIKELALLNKKKIPTFGICMGHQLMALASGAKTKKLKFGHRGANQPVKDLDTGRIYITSQNHGYAVVPGSIAAEIAEVNMANANDKTCEGVRYKKMPCFTVQFHPEACGGPKDTEFLFDRFLEMVEEHRNA